MSVTPITGASIPNILRATELREPISRISNLGVSPTSENPKVDTTKDQGYSVKITTDHSNPLFAKLAAELVNSHGEGKSLFSRQHHSHNRG